MSHAEMSHECMSELGYWGMNIVDSMGQEGSQVTRNVIVFFIKITLDLTQGQSTFEKL